MLNDFDAGSTRWRNNVFLLSLYNGAEGVFSGLLWSIYAVYLVELGFSGIEFGFVSMLNALVGGFLSLVSGLIVDKFGAKFLLILGHIMRSLGIVFLWLGSFITISAYSIVSGLSTALFLAAHNVILSLSVPREKMHYAFTRVEALMLLGMFFGGLAGWIPKIVSDAYGLPLVESYKLTLLLCSVGSFILVTLLLMIKEHPKGADRVQVGEPNREELKEFRRIILSLGIAAILVGLGAGISIHIIGFYFAKKYGITSGEYGSLFAAENLAMGLLMLITPNIADRVGGPLKTYLALISLSIPFLLAITFVNSFMVAAVLYFIRTTLMNAANPLYTAVAMRLVKPSLRGRTMGIIIASRNIFAGIGRFFGGTLLDVDLELPLRITAVMYVSYVLFIKFMIEPLVKTESAWVGTGGPETVCVGEHAVELMEFNGLYDKVKGNIVVYAESYSKTAMLPAVNAVDAIIGWHVFHYQYPNKTDIVWLKPEQIPRISYIPIGVLKYSENYDAALKFIEFATSSLFIKEVFRKISLLC